MHPRSRIVPTIVLVACAGTLAPTENASSTRRKRCDISLSYEDPKVADGTLEGAERYDERCRQTATETLYLFSRAS